MPSAVEPQAGANPETVHDEAVADQMDEEFDVVDENNNPVSRSSRKKCHEEGLLHRSTHVFLFRSRIPVGQLSPITEVLLQKRSEKKKVGPNQWDVSVAEHLSAGENYVEATSRGFKEELGLSIADDCIVRVREPYLSRQFYKEAAVLDNMFTSTFAALYDERLHGPVRIDEVEVQLVEWWPIERVVSKGKQESEEFTRWLLIELRNIDMIELGKNITGEL